MTPKVCNIGLRLQRAAAAHPDKPAVLHLLRRDAGGPRYGSLSFAQLDRRSDACARGLRAVGIGRGVKTLLMVRPGPDFYIITFALFKAGAVPVLIDPGMGLRRLLHCVRQVEPEALVGVPAAHAARVLCPGYFKSVKLAVTVGRRWFWGGHRYGALPEGGGEAAEPTRADELAAILFTTGSTGPAKGVEYEHGMFEAQCRILETTFGVGPEDVDLPTFPPFGLFSVGLGMTAVIPEMDPTRPAAVDPERIIEAVNANRCTFSFGSPALWGKVGRYCAERGIKLPSLRKVLMAGAPVPPETHEALRRVLPEGAQTHTPYGATESLPVADVTGAEVLSETAARTREGGGYCVGRPVAGVELRVIGISDGLVREWDESLALPPGKIGEIVTAGENITKRYYRLEEATAQAKIADGVRVRHRMGDAGYLDAQGRLWFCGRKAHRVETTAGTLFTVCCEAIFNRHPRVRRSALVGLGERPAQRAAIIIELKGGLPAAAERERLTAELLELGKTSELTRGIGALLFHPAFPVDIRHNAKINREELAAWAAGETGA